MSRGKRELGNRTSVPSSQSVRPAAKKKPFLPRVAPLVQQVENDRDGAPDKNCASKKILRNGNADHTEYNDPNGDDESSDLRIHPHEAERSGMSRAFMTLHRFIVLPFKSSCQPQTNRELRRSAY